MQPRVRSHSKEQLTSDEKLVDVNGDRKLEEALFEALDQVLVHIQPVKLK